MNTETPLFQVCKNGDLEKLKELIPIHAYTNCHDMQKRSSTAESCKQNFVININKPDGFCGQLPLIISVNYGHTNLVSYLLKCGADVNPDKGQTPLYIASNCGYTDIVDLLLQNGADINKYNYHYGLFNRGYYPTPLIGAIKSKNIDIIDRLLYAGANVNEIVNEKTALNYACEIGNIDIINRLIIHGADINLCAPLVTACEHKKIKVVKKLLDTCADVNVRDKNSLTPLIISVIKGYIDIIEIILEYNPDLSIEDIHWKTALDYAKTRPQIKLLLLNYI